jgi:hypothetical protein
MSSHEKYLSLAVKELHLYMMIIKSCSLSREGSWGRERQSLSTMSCPGSKKPNGTEHHLIPGRFMQPLWDFTAT